MQDETENDPASDEEIEVCRTCQELTERLRNEAGRLRAFSESEFTHGSPHNESQRENLIRCRDSALEELADDQRLHSEEPGYQTTSLRISEMSDERRDWAAAWKESRLKDAPISVLEKTIANAVGHLVSDHYKAHICNIEYT